MPDDPNLHYWMDDDGGGFFDDSGGDDYDDDGGQDDDDQDQDDQDGEEESPDDEFSDPDDLVELDDDVALNAADFPNATQADFEEDDGSWTPDDYQQSAANLFGDHEFFGDTLATARAAEGYTPFSDPGFIQGFDEV